MFPRFTPTLVGLPTEKTFLADVDVAERILKGLQKYQGVNVWK
jgi:hypothetical protein